MKITFSNPIEEKESYELKMIMNNTFSYILPMEVTVVDNVRMYAFDIENMKSMKSYYDTKKLCKEDVCRFLECLKQTIAEFGEYLISSDKIILKPEYIFLKEREVFFCVSNENGVDFSSGLEKLLEYFLERADYDDKEGVLSIYELYHKVVRDHMPIENIVVSEYDSKRNIIEERIEDNIIVPRECEILENPTEALPKKDYVKYCMLAVVGIVFAIIIFWDYFSVDINKWVMMGLLLISVTVLYFKVKSENNSVKQPQTDGYDNETVLLSPSDIGVYLVYDDNGEQKRVRITKSPFIIGSHREQVDLCLKKMSVSRVHARIFNEGENYFIEDVNSKNGTKVNDRKLRSYEVMSLEKNDLISIADIDLIFK